MDWANELEIASKKLLPKLGRRAGQNSNTQDSNKHEDDGEMFGSLSSATSGRMAPVAPPRARKTGWGDELKSAKSKSTNFMEQERIKRKINIEDIDNDIPIIPDIEEIQTETILNSINNDSSIGINRVTAYKELDTDLINNSSFAFLDDINLSLLTEKLYPKKLVQEADEVWNWDLLFTQISSELNSEAQAKLII